MLTPRPHVRTRAVADDLILYSPSTDAITRLDRIGSIVWQLTEGRPSIADLTQQVADVFSIDPEMASSDLAYLIEELVDAELVELSDPAAEQNNHTRS